MSKKDLFKLLLNLIICSLLIAAGDGMSDSITTGQPLLQTIVPKIYELFGMTVLIVSIAGVLFLDEEN